VIILQRASFWPYLQVCNSSRICVSCRNYRSSSKDSIDEERASRGEDDAKRTFETRTKCNDAHLCAISRL